MSRVLLVTNDFPPRRGGIQSYLQELVGHLVDTGAHTLTVYAPKWKGSDEFDRAAAYEVVRHPEHVDAARTVCRQADAATHRTSQRRDRVVRGGRTAGTDGAARSRRGRRPGDREHARARGGLVDAAAGPDGVAPHRIRDRRGDLRQQLHPTAVRLGVRSARGARAPAGRRGHRAVRARRGRARRAARPLPVGRSPRRGLSCRAWCRARVRTC